MPFYDPNRELQSKLFDIMLLFSMMSGFGLLSLTFIYFYLFPFSCVQFGSVVPNTTVPVLIPFRFFLIYVYPHYITVSHAAMGSIFLTAVIIYGVLVVPFLAKELCLDRKEYKCLAVIRQPPKLIQMYRASQLLQLNALDVYQYPIIVSQALVMDLTMFACVMIIGFGNQMALSSKMMLLSWAFITCSVWTGVLMMGGYMHWNGGKVLKSWKYNQWSSKADKRLMSKFRKSCKPLMFHCGKYYAIRRLSVLKFLRGISKGIFKSLLALQ